MSASETYGATMAATAVQTSMVAAVEPLGVPLLMLMFAFAEGWTYFDACLRDPTPKESKELKQRNHQDHQCPDDIKSSGSDK
jgi:hypothetical protein